MIKHKIVLSGKAAREFMDILSEPAQPKEALRKLLQEPSALEQRSVTAVDPFYLKGLQQRILDAYRDDGIRGVNMLFDLEISVMSERQPK